MSMFDKFSSALWPKETAENESLLLPQADQFFEIVENREGEAKRGRFIAPRLGRWIIENYRIKTMGFRGAVYVYDGGVYHPNGEEKIHSLCDAILGDDFTARRLAEVISSIKGLTYSTRDEQPEPNLVCVDNGILDLFSGVLQPHNPDLFLTAQIPVEYIPGADCPAIKKFVSEIVRPDDVQVIQELAGWLLYGSYEPQKAVMCIGEGANGKSTLISLLRAFMGSSNVSSVSLQTLAVDDFARSRLYGKMANMFADLPDKALSETGNFKMLTGGDAMHADLKFRDGFDFANKAKLIFSCNKLPVAYDETDAYMRRWTFLNFPNKFDGAARNPNKLRELTTPQELSGLLCWAMEGLKRMLANGDFSNGKATEEIRDYYERMSSPVVAFAKDKIQQDSQGFISKTDLYAAFCDYCNENKLPAVSKETFGKNLVQHFGSAVMAAQRTLDAKKGVWVWAGIRLATLRTLPTLDFSRNKPYSEKNNTESRREEKTSVRSVGSVQNQQDGFNSLEIVSKLRAKHNFDNLMPDDAVLTKCLNERLCFEVSPGRFREL